MGDVPTTLADIMEKVKNDTSSVSVDECKFKMNNDAGNDPALLTISWSTRSDPPVPKEFPVNLDSFIGNIGGQLVWGGKGFSSSELCEDIKVDETTGVLSAKCFYTSFNDSESKEIRLRDDKGVPIHVIRTLDLKDHIVYDRASGSFDLVAGDSQFSEVISSPSWMKYAIIAQPDMGSFLKQMPVQEAVRDVARRTAKQVMHQTELVLAHVVKAALKAIEDQMPALIDDELGRLAKKAALTTGYSGFVPFTPMHDAAYHVMAGHSEPFQKLLRSGD